MRQMWVFIKAISGLHNLKSFWETQRTLTQAKTLEPSGGNGVSSGPVCSQLVWKQEYQHRRLTPGFQRLLDPGSKSSEILQSLQLRADLDLNAWKYLSTLSSWLWRGPKTAWNAVHAGDEWQVWRIFPACVWMTTPQRPPTNVWVHSFHPNFKYVDRHSASAMQSWLDFWGRPSCDIWSRMWSWEAAAQTDETSWMTASPAGMRSSCSCWTSCNVSAVEGFWLQTEKLHIHQEDQSTDYCSQTFMKTLKFMEKLQLKTPANQTCLISNDIKDILGSCRCC